MLCVCIFSKQEKDVLYAMCHLCTFLVTLKIVMQHKRTPHNTIGRTNAKILVSALDRQVSCGDTNDEVVDH